MACQYCKQVGTHAVGCPLYEEPEPIDYCIICKTGIFDGDEIIENGDERVHADCASSDFSWFCEWLDIPVVTVEDSVPDWVEAVYNEDYE